ncbi:MAG: LEA type 2 family protein [Balneolaceae bacterium]|nr:LEA type 2 family protein [Balneolaceae bacterium]
MKKILPLLVLFLFLTSCALIRDYADVQRPSVNFSKMSIQNISFDGVTLLFDFDVNNPNRFGVSADQYSYEFFINDNSFLSGTQQENIRISRESSSVVQVPVSLNFSDVFSTFTSLVRRDSLSYKIATEVQFDIPGLGRQRVPVSTAGELPIPRMPRIEFSGLNVRNLSLSGADIDLGFRVSNPNSFGISLSNAAYVFRVNGREWLDTRLGDRIRIGGSQSDTVTIPVRLNASQMGSVLLDLIGGSTQFDYNLSGSANISAELEGFQDGETIPFDVSGRHTTN